MRGHRVNADRALAVAGLVLSLGILAFVIYLAIAQATLNAKADCWDHRVLDHAVQHPARTKAAHNHLIAVADQCARLP